MSSALEVEEWASVFKAAYGATDEKSWVIRRFVEASAAQPELGMHDFVMRFEGKPTTIGTLIRKGDCALLAADGTLESHRGRGFGEAMLRHRIKVGASLGVRHFVILTSSAGSRKYAERSGFRLAGNHLQFGPG